MTRSKPTGRLSASGRARVVAWILGVSALGMVLMLVSIVLTLRWVERDAIETSLTQESDEVAVFAQNGRDPETGEPFATPERFVGHYLERQRVEPTELMFGGTAAAPADSTSRRRRSRSFSNSSNVSSTLSMKVSTSPT